MEKYSKHVPQYPIRDNCLQKMKNLVFIIKNLDWNADNYFITNAETRDWTRDLQILSLTLFEILNDTPKVQQISYTLLEKKTVAEMEWFQVFPTAQNMEFSIEGFFSECEQIRNIFPLRISLQKQPPKVFYKKSILKNFVKFTGKHQCQSVFLIKLQVSGLQLY